jgi:hypothetical protein
MPEETGEGPELSLVLLILMIFSQIAISTKRGSVNVMPCLSGEEDAIYPLFHELKKDFGKDIPALESMHFIETGAFPHSHELEDALYWAKKKGGYSEIDGKLFLHYFRGAEVVLQGLIDVLSEVQKDFPEQFRALVSRFEKIRVPV